MNLCKPASVILLSLSLFSCGHTGPSSKQNIQDSAAAEATVSLTSLPDSLARLEAVIKADSANADAWFEKGLLLTEMKDTLRAITSLETSLAIQPVQPTAVALANLYAESKNERAIALCNALLLKDTAHSQVDPVFIKGVYYTRTGDDKKAIAQFDECIKRDWKFVEAYIEKGIIQYNQKKIPEALKTFKLASTVSSSYADAFFWMGRCFEIQGIKKEAAENYSKALALDKDFTEAEQALRRINIL